MKTNNIILESLRERRKFPVRRRIKNIGYISVGINENTVYNPIFEGDKKSRGIREVNYDDVTSEHFLKWFFDMDDWQDYTP